MLARRWAVLLLALPLLAVPPGRTGLLPAPLGRPERTVAVVFCADGAGGLGETADTLAQVIAEEAVPLHRKGRVVTWGGSLLVDHLDRRNLQIKGEGLARERPGSGSRTTRKPHLFRRAKRHYAVVLLAAEAMPANSVDRVVLLAPSVSSGYDLRPALRATREGIDVFYSESDWFVLGLGMAFSGTTDGQLPPVAGRVGFRRIVENTSDEALYARLRQHPWGPEVEQTGRTGGHYGALEAGHVRARILPMLAPNPRARLGHIGGPLFSEMKDQSPPLGSHGEGSADQSREVRFDQLTSDGADPYARLPPIASCQAPAMDSLMKENNKNRSHFHCIRLEKR